MLVILESVIWSAHISLLLWYQWGWIIVSGKLMFFKCNCIEELHSEFWNGKKMYQNCCNMHGAYNLPLLLALEFGWGPARTISSCKECNTNSLSSNCTYFLPHSSILCTNENSKCIKLNIPTVNTYIANKNHPFIDCSSKDFPLNSWKVHKMKNAINWRRNAIATICKCNQCKKTYGKLHQT